MADQSGVLSGSDIGAVYRRRKIPMLVTIAITLVLSSYFALTPPSIYRSTAHIQIEQQEISQNLVDSGSAEFEADEIGASTQQVMTQANLLPIIDSLDLYPVARETLSPEELFAKIRSNILINTITEERIHPRTGRPLLKAVAFKVSFDNTSPVNAQQVAAILGELYLTINHQRRTQRAEGTSAFLSGESNRLKGRIVELEQWLAEFKKENTYLLPEYADYNFQLIERTNTEIERQKERIKALIETRALLGSSQAVIDPLDIARAQLAEAMQKYTQQHPKVLTLKRAVANLERQAGNSGGQPAYASSGDQASIRAQQQLRTINKDISIAQTQLAELERKIKGYESRLTRSPDIERQYLAVSRDYENALKKYSEMKDKEMEARMVEELERANKAGRFILLQAPMIPAKPIGPNRVGIISLGLAISLLGSFILASFLEYLDPTVRGTEGVNAVLHEPPLGVVPYISN